MNKHITPEEFDEFKLRVINVITKDLDQYGSDNSTFELMPTIYLKAFNKTYKACPLPGELFASEDLKDLVVKLAKDMIQEAESPMMCFVTEGYQAKMPSDVDINNLPRPSQLPEDQREEVVFLCFESINLDQYCMSFIKEYNNDTKKWKLTPQIWDTNPNVKAKGRFANFYTN